MRHPEGVAVPLERAHDRVAVALDAGEGVAGRWLEPAAGDADGHDAAAEAPREGAVGQERDPALAPHHAVVAHAERAFEVGVKGGGLRPRRRALVGGRSRRRTSADVLDEGAAPGEGQDVEEARLVAPRRSEVEEGSDARVERVVRRVDLPPFEALLEQNVARARAGGELARAGAAVEGPAAPVARAPREDARAARAVFDALDGGPHQPHVRPCREGAEHETVEVEAANGVVAKGGELEGPGGLGGFGADEKQAAPRTSCHGVEGRCGVGPEGQSAIVAVFAAGLEHENAATLERAPDQAVGQAEAGGAGTDDDDVEVVSPRGVAHSSAGVISRTSSSSSTTRIVRGGCAIDSPSAHAPRPAPKSILTRYCPPSGRTLTSSPLR